MRWAGHIACMGEGRKVYKVLVEKLEGKTPFGSLRCRRDDGIKMDHREICWEGVKWIHLAQDRDHWWAVVK
jgi:hypothetical protein